MPRLPSSADVPTVTPASDPGVQAPSGVFQSPLGVAAQELAPAVSQIANTKVRQEVLQNKKFAEIAQRQQDQQDAIAKSRAVNKLNAENHQELTGLSTSDKPEDDLSNHQTLDRYGASMAQRAQDILDNFSGSDAAKAKLQVRLQDINASFAGKAGALSTKIAGEHIDQSLQEGMAPLLSSAESDPSPENINKIIDQDIPTLLDDFRGGISQVDEGPKEKALQQDVALAAIDKLIISGNAEKAESLLVDSGLNNFLTSENQRAKQRQIEEVFKHRNDAQEEANTAFLVEQAKLRARRENMNIILQGVPSLTPEGTDNTIDTPAITAPFGEGQEPSDDMKSALRLFTTSRRLLLTGDPNMARTATGLISEARFIIENSPAIQRDRDLDKPISPDLAREFGVPVGTTLRSVASAIPSSPEQLAVAKSRGAALGRGQVKGKEQLAFIGEAKTLINDLNSELAKDPKLVGTVGGLRAAGQTTIGVLKDLGADKIVETAKNIALESGLSIDDQEGFFDNKTLSVLSLIENSLGMIFAKLQTPQGQRIPVEVIKRSISDVKLTGLRGAKQVQNRLDFIMKRLNQRESSIQKTFNLPSQQQSTSRFRIENGKLVPVAGE